MRNALEKQTSPVRRITIDEKLADDLIRVLTAELKSSVTTFSDDPDYWGEEDEFLIHSNLYHKEMGLTRVDIEELFWKILLESGMTQDNTRDWLRKVLLEMGMIQDKVEKWLPRILHDTGMAQDKVEEWLRKNLHKLGMTQDDVKKWLWDNLKEGQVFLQGTFREVSRKEAEAAFEVDKGQWNFQRIDYFSKSRVKKVYMEALERSIPDVETNQTR